jgi:DNA-binding transcriptional MocR family regulator
MRPESRLTVLPAASVVRRTLAPSAWLVLEELARTAGDDDMAVTNVRVLAADLGLSKDTAARALERLIAAGLVERTENRDTGTGQFGTVAYRVDLVAARLEVASNTSTSPETSDDVAAPGAPRSVELTPPAEDLKHRGREAISRETAEGNARRQRSARALPRLTR